jgi:hypothetical protein
MENYETYAWRLNGTRISLVIASVPCRYLDSLGRGMLPGGRLQLKLLTSEECDLLQEPGRREVVRMIVGVFRSLRQRLGANQQ